MKSKIENRKSKIWWTVIFTALGILIATLPAGSGTMAKPPESREPVRIELVVPLIARYHSNDAFRAAASVAGFSVHGVDFACLADGDDDRLVFADGGISGAINGVGGDFAILDGAISTQPNCLSDEQTSVSVVFNTPVAGVIFNHAAGTEICCTFSNTLPPICGEPSGDWTSTGFGLSYDGFTSCNFIGTASAVSFYRLP